MKLGDYILSDDDIKDCQKRVEWLKNIIWIIENKPNQEMLTDDSILDMDGQNNSDISEYQNQDLTKINVSDETQIATENKESEKEEKTEVNKALDETKGDENKGVDNKRNKTVFKHAN